MFRETYRKEMEQVLLNERQKERLAGLMAAAPARRTRHVGRTALIAAAVCALCIVTALAASPTLRDILGQSLGSFGPYSQEVEGVSATDQGIRVSVVRALADQSGGTVYLEVQDLTGDRLTEDTQFSSWVRPMAYDPESRTLLARLEFYGTDFLDREEDGMAEVSIGEIWGGEFFEGIPLPADLLEADNMLATMAAPEDQSHGTNDGRIVLVPEQTPRALEGAPWFTLSSMGFDGQDRLHVQLKMQEGWEDQLPDHCFYADLAVLHQCLEDAYGGSGRYDLVSLQGRDYRLENGRYLDFCLMPCVDVRMEDGKIAYDYLPREAYRGLPLTLQGWIGTRERVEGDWTLRFPLEILPERTVTVNQPVNTKLAETFTLTARSASLRSAPQNGRQGSLQLLPLTVYLEDGTRVTVPRGRCVDAGWESGGTGFNTDTWTFPDPIDPAQVTAFSLGYWYVPLDGDTARPAGWRAELPEPPEDAP